jgi:putative transposase
MPLKGKRLKKNRKNYSTIYVVKTTSGGVPRKEAVKAYSVMKYYDGTRSKTKGVRQLCYISFGVSLRPKQVAETYRKRFGIESSYKLSNRKRARTSSRNAGYRAFLFAVSLLIQNAWVTVKRMYCKRTARWSRSFISLQDFTNVLLAVIREAYGEFTKLRFET